MNLPSMLRNRRPFLAAHSLFVNQQRTSTRESIHRHVEPDKLKKHMLAASEPYIRRKYILPEESCKGTASPKVELQPLDKILVQELLQDLAQSEFVLFVQYNYTKFQSERVYKNTITKLGGKFHALNNQIYREALTTLNLDHLNHLFIGRNSLITGQVDCLTPCVKALKKMPQFILLAGMIDKHVIELDQLNLIVASPTLDQSRANLLGTLNTPAFELTSYLEQHLENIKEPGDLETSENKPDNP